MKIEEPAAYALSQVRLGWRAVKEWRQAEEAAREALTELTRRRAEAESLHRDAVEAAGALLLAQVGQPADVSVDEDGRGADVHLYTGDDLRVDA